VLRAVKSNDALKSSLKLCDRVCTLLVCLRIIEKYTPFCQMILLAGLKSLCIWDAPSLTAMGALHLTALTALTLLRALGCNTVFGSAPEDEHDLRLSSEVSQQTLDLAVGSSWI
jgi:hypothetical protein